MTQNRSGKAEELVTYLKGLTPGELSAYCSGVLSARGAAPPEVLVEALRVMAPESPDEPEDRRLTGGRSKTSEAADGP